MLYEYPIHHLLKIYDSFIFVQIIQIPKVYLLFCHSCATFLYFLSLGDSTESRNCPASVIETMIIISRICFYNIGCFPLFWKQCMLGNNIRIFSYGRPIRRHRIIGNLISHRLTDDWIFLKAGFIHKEKARWIHINKSVLLVTMYFFVEKAGRYYSDVYI